MNEAWIHEPKLLPTREGNLVAVGKIYKDSSKQFSDGSMVKTTSITSFDGVYLVTKDMKYKVVIKK